MSFHEERQQQTIANQQMSAESPPLKRSSDDDDDERDRRRRRRRRQEDDERVETSSEDDNNGEDEMSEGNNSSGEDEMIEGDNSSGEDEMSEDDNSSGEDEMSEDDNSSGEDDIPSRIDRMRILDALYEKRYERYVTNGPGWIGEYHRTVLCRATNDQHRELWRRRCTQSQPWPPRLVRYVSVMCNAHVQGPFRVSNNRHVCCVNECSSRPLVNPPIRCGFCSIHHDDEARDEQRRVVVEPCLCDCLVFRYHMCWRGEYVRKLRTRYDYTRAFYAKFSNRARAYRRRDYVVSRINGTRLVVVLVVSDLVGCALAAMGFAPVEREDDRFFIRCHRCFACVLLNDDDHQDEDVAAVDTSRPGRLNALFSEIDKAHRDSNPFCPYVVTIHYDDEEFEAISHEYQHKFRKLILYSTRFNLPGYGGSQGELIPLRLWSDIPVSPQEDILFHPPRGRNCCDWHYANNATRHVMCSKYASRRHLTPPQNSDKIDPIVDSRYDVTVRARPMAAYRRAIEFVDAKHQHPPDDYAYDARITRVCSILHRMRRWRQERLGCAADETDPIPTSSPFRCERGTEKSEADCPNN